MQEVATKDSLYVRVLDTYRFLPVEGVFSDCAQRRAGSPEGPEELLLDGNALAEGEDFFAIRGFSVSSGENILAFATDTVGRRIYTVRFKDLQSGEILDDEIGGTNGNLAWAEDNRTLFYTRRDPETLRSFQIFRHELGSDAEPFARKSNGEQIVPFRLVRSIQPCLAWRKSPTSVPQRALRQRKEAARLSVSSL